MLVVEECEKKENINELKDLPIKESDFLVEQTKECAFYFNFREPIIGSYKPTYILPESIECVYTTDLNIITIHNIIKDLIYTLMIKTNELISDVCMIDAKLQYNNNTPLSIKSLLKTRENKVKEYQKIIEGKYWENYCQKSIPILNIYTPLMSNEYKESNHSVSTSFLDEEKIEERHLLISKYLDVVKSLDIIELNVLRDFRKGKICFGCLKDLSSKVDDENNMCKCGFNQDKINHKTEYTDINKFSLQNNSNNEHNKTITLWLDRFLCRSAEDYPREKIFSDFDRICITDNLPNRFDVINGYLIQPPCDKIITLLKTTGNSKYYNIKNKIRKDYYGWKVPEISDSQEVQIINLYIQIQEQYIKHKPIDRKTNISSEIIGYVILRIVGVDVKFSDFKIPNSTDTLFYSKDTLYDILISLGFKSNQIPSMSFT